jgi:hypothetical protein
MEKLAIAAFWIFAVALVIFLYGRIMYKYWSRPCMGARWKRRFPNAHKTDIRKFLTLFVSAFAFMKRRRLKFEPDDRIMDIYHTLYPKNWPMGDQMECETFAENVKSEYGVDLVQVWRKDMTLGEVFELAQSAKK